MVVEELSVKQTGICNNPECKAIIFNFNTRDGSDNWMHLRVGRYEKHCATSRVAVPVPGSIETYGMPYDSSSNRPMDVVQAPEAEPKPERESWSHCIGVIFGSCNDGRMQPWRGTDGHDGMETFYTCDRCGRRG